MDWQDLLIQHQHRISTQAKPPLGPSEGSLSTGSLVNCPGLVCLWGVKAFERGRLQKGQPGAQWTHKEGPINTGSAVWHYLFRRIEGESEGGGRGGGDGRRGGINEGT